MTGTNTTTKNSTRPRKCSPTSMRATNARDEKIAALHEQITEGVQALVASGAWQAMLDTAARFHRYSFGNQILIAIQAPAATRVAGFGTWKSLSRQVRKGEKGIAILAPCTYRPKTDESTPTQDTDNATNADAEQNSPTRRQLRGFRAAYVFDVAQTDGDPLRPISARPRPPAPCLPGSGTGSPPRSPLTATP